MSALALANEFRANVDGTVMVPCDAGYDAAREIWNRLFDHCPAIIVRPVATADVVAAVTLARKHGLQIAIKGGGHHVAGHASADGALMLDMTALRRVNIDREARKAVIGTGLTWADLDEVTQASDLACTGPIVSMTGVAGFTLGGGFGWLHRKIGLACDNLLAVEIVTADGEVLRVSDTENADLLWGLKGAGWSFGVVTAMELSLHAVGPTVVAGLIYWPLDRFPDLVDYYRNLMPEFPDELTTWFFLRLAPSLPAIPKDWVARPVVALAMCHCGALKEGYAWAKRFAEVKAPIANMVSEIEYRLWQRALDTRWGNGFFNDWRGQYLDDLNPEAVAVLMRHVERLTSPWTDIKVPHLAGAVSRIGDTDSAYGNRSARFGLVIQARWERAEETAAQIAWARHMRDALAPHATGGAYANFLGIDEGDRAAAAHGPQNLLRLSGLKAKYDPDKVFKFNPDGPALA